MTEPLDSTPEEWRPVKGYEFYSVSNLGRIRREISPWRRSTRLLKPFIGEKGYLDVGLRSPGKNKSIRLHRLIALAFLPPVPGKTNINHKNGDKTDARADNLEWCTMSENQRHRHDVLKKGALSGETHNWAKLTNEQVIEIRRLYATGKYTQLEVAAMFGMKTVHSIVVGSTWKHLLPPSSGSDQPSASQIPLES
jgi:NUMOD4 motif.